MELFISLITVLLVMAAAGVVALRMGYFHDVVAAGRGRFFTAAGFLIATATWEVLKSSDGYGALFVSGLYPVLDLLQLIALIVGGVLLAASLIAYADQWRRKENEIALKDDRNGLLARIQHEAKNPYPITELLQLALKELVATLPQGAGAALLFNRVKKEFVLTASTNLTAGELSALERNPAGPSQVIQAIEMQEAVSGRKFSLSREQWSHNSYVVLPMVSGTDKIGVVILFSAEERAFGMREIQLFTPVTDWFAERIRTSRLTKEFGQIKSQLSDERKAREGFVSRVAAASKAITLQHGLTEVCKGLVGLLGAQSVYACSLRNGALVIEASSEPIGGLSENFKVALMETISRRRSLIINQESDSGVINSSLVIPVTDGGRQLTLMLRKDSVFRVSEGELKTVDVFLPLLAAAQGFDEHRRSANASSQSVDSVIRLLSSETRDDHKIDERSLNRIISAIVPSGSIVLTGRIQKDKVVIDAHEVSDVPLHLEKSGTIIGRAIDEFRPKSMYGSQVREQLDALEPVTAETIRSMTGERGWPNMLSVIPISNGRTPIYVSLVLVYTAEGGELNFLERLLTLASGLLSLRLTVSEMEKGDKPLTPIDVTASGISINTVNNHLATVVGRAELLTLAEEMSEESKAALKEIITAAEKAAEETMKLAAKRVAHVTPALENPAESSLNDVLIAVLRDCRISGNLYMAGGKPRELEFLLGETAPVEFSTTGMRSLFGQVLDQMASYTGEEEIISVSTYRKDSYLYLDISRRRRDFPALRHVAEIANYETARSIYEAGVAQQFLKELFEQDATVALDREGAQPAYLSFKFPLKGVKSASLSRTAMHPVRILAVDDQMLILDLIEAMCQSLGYGVARASSGKEALDLVSKNKYDIVFTDLAMPDVSGLEVSRRIKQIQPNARVILVTGFEKGLESSQIASAGVSDVLRKPFRIEQLTDLVQSTLVSKS